jgi:hypothetical protein
VAAVAPENPSTSAAVGAQRIAERLVDAEAY